MHIMQRYMVQEQTSGWCATFIRVSDRDLVRAWRGLLERYHATSCALERALSQEHQLGVSEFEVLDWLVETQSPDSHCRVQDLATSVHLSQSALSRVIARLEADGLVTRAMCSEDRRGIYVHLTEEGRARHARARPTQRAVLAAQQVQASGSREPTRPEAKPPKKPPPARARKQPVRPRARSWGGDAVSVDVRAATALRAHQGMALTPMPVSSREPATSITLAVALANSFKRAGDTLLVAALASECADELLYPVLFNYRHSRSSPPADPDSPIDRSFAIA
jgi:DNA-binding MarR family transcriptional regulator